MTVPPLVEILSVFYQIYPDGFLDKLVLCAAVVPGTHLLDGLLCLRGNS